MQKSKKFKFLNTTFLTLLSVVFLGVAILFFMLSFILSQSKDVNKSGESYEYCLHPKNITKNTNPNLQTPDITIQLESESGAIFEIKYIKNAGENCINPDFPIIFIDTKTKHSGWIQIVYTDSIDPKLRKFVDYDPKFTNAPFYSNSQYFYDAPLWSYSLYEKPLTFWRAHTFAIIIDDKNKTIDCIGGIEWGFEFHATKSKPVAIDPKLLDKKVWEDDWEIIKEQLPEYRKI
jgi:hypothetical protein